MEAGGEPRVTAVVVNWNGCDDTLACLASLAASRPCPEVILVDNGSTDGSVTAVQAQFPAVDVIALLTNRHFAAGANAGLARGLAKGADFLWLLNNDVLVAPDALAELLRVVTNDTKIGIAGPQIHHPFDPPGTIVGANCNWRTGTIDEPRPPADFPGDRLVVDYVWGCAMLIRAEVLQGVGLLDESLVAYFEDTDLCLRARQAGWLTVAALRAAVDHAGSKSANRVFLSQMWLRGRNWWRCFLRHAPAADRRRLRLALLTRRLPHLAWSTLVTIAARKLRPRGRPIRLR